MNFENRPTHSLRPYPGNARTHSPKQIKQISRSIKTFGFNNPVLVDDDDQIIAGHGRVEAAKLLNMKTVPTVRLSLRLCRGARVNAEQASKRTMRRPTRRPFRGRLIRLGEVSEAVRPDAAPGSGDSMYTRKAYETREAPKRGQRGPTGSP
jgi:ParB-like nuclease domain